jgi:membrane protein YdbS with pleckstrin-like domain
MTMTSDGGAGTAPVARLRPPRHRVSRRAIAYWTVRAGVGWLVPLGAQVVWLLSDLSNPSPHVLWLAVTVIVAAVHVVVMPQWRFRVHRWETTPEAVYTQAGWLNQSRRIAPVSRIQTVDTARGPVEQLFGLTNVTVTTASAAGPLKIDGLDHETAQRLVDELTSTTQAHPGDAT